MRSFFFLQLVVHTLVLLFIRYVATWKFSNWRYFPVSFQRLHCD